jgi:hypothetical protein
MCAQKGACNYCSLLSVSKIMETFLLAALVFIRVGNKKAVLLQSFSGKLTDIYTTLCMEMAKWS